MMGSLGSTLSLTHQPSWLVSCPCPQHKCKSLSHLPYYTLTGNRSPPYHPPERAAQAAVRIWELGEDPRQGPASAGGGSEAHLGDGQVPLLPLFPSLLQLACPGRLACLQPGTLFGQQTGRPLWKGRRHFSNSCAISKARSRITKNQLGCRECFCCPQGLLVPVGVLPLRFLES